MPSSTSSLTVHRCTCSNSKCVYIKHSGILTSLFNIVTQQQLNNINAPEAGILLRNRAMLETIEHRNVGTESPYHLCTYEPESD